MYSNKLYSIKILFNYLILIDFIFSILEEMTKVQKKIKNAISAKKYRKKEKERQNELIERYIISIP